MTMMTHDFTVHPLPYGDTELRPRTQFAREYCRRYAEIFGAGALTDAGGIYVETSRDPAYLVDTLAELRDTGFAVLSGA